MPITIEYITTATVSFLSLQSGFARPYWEVGITVSGESTTTSATLGQAYGTNDIISMGTIDRAKPIEISGLSRIIAGNLTLTLNNASDIYSPMATASIFTDAAGSARDYMHSKINVWAGFIQDSGTALVMQRGSFLLTQLRIDSSNRQAYLTSEDAAKIPLQESVGLPEASGTATVWTPPSGISTKSIMTELLSAVGLSASQYSIASGIDMPSYSIEEKNVANALAEIAQANDGFVYTNGQGKVTFELNAPIFGGQATDLALNEHTNIMKSRYSINVKNLVNNVIINYGSGSDNFRGASDATVTKGRTQSITNEAIDRASIAASLSSKLLSKYSKNRPFLELDNIWLPSIEIGDVVSFTDENTHSTGVSYEVYRVREDISKLKTKLYCIDLTYDDIKGANRQKWAFLSDNSAVACGTVFTDSWHSGFAFLSYDTTTATNPGFDAEGNNDDVITTAYAASGAGTTGIERPFLAY